MAVVSGSPAPFQAGDQLIDGSALNAQFAKGLGSGNANGGYADGLVAAGTTAPTGLQLTAVYNRFATVASGAGCNLPQATPGSEVIIDVRAAANTINIYSSQVTTTDTIDGTIGTTAATLSVAHGAAKFVCYKAGAWISYLMGAATS